MLTGIILAGGKGRRFGENKALARINGRYLIEWVIAQYRLLFEEIIISTNNPSQYAFTGIKTLRDIIPNRGPLVGIYSSLRESSNEWSFVSACDMPFIRPSLIEYMVHQSAGYDVVVPSVGERMLEPLHALYRKSCIPAIQRAVEADEKRIVSFYPEVKVYRMEKEEILRHDPDLISFFNINTRKELKKAKELFTLLRYTFSHGCQS